ncbi:MAG: hypothetical protein ABR941_01190 [Thermoleophilia bacterium]
MEQGVDALGDADAGGDAQERSDEAERTGLADHAGQHLAARGAQRAQHGELADALGDGDREGVEDDEGADDHGHPAEGQQDGSQNVADGVADGLGRVGHGLRRGLDLGVGRQRLREARGERLGRDARLGGDRDARILAIEIVPALGVGHSGRDQRGAADRRRVAKVEHARDDDLPDTLFGGEADRVAHLQVLVAGQLGVDRDRAVARRRRTGDVRAPAEARRRRRKDQGGRPAGVHGLAVHDHGAAALDATGGVGHTAHGLDLAEQRNRQRTAGGEQVLALERRLVRDVHVGADRRLLEDVVKTVVDLVGDDVGAGDHGDPQHDRQHREDRAELAAPQVAQRQADHRAGPPLRSELASSDLIVS